MSSSGSLLVFCTIAARYLWCLRPKLPMCASNCTVSSIHLLVRFDWCNFELPLAAQIFIAELLFTTFGFGLITTGSSTPSYVQYSRHATSHSCGRNYRTHELCLRRIQITETVVLSCTYKSTSIISAGLFWLFIQLYR